MEFHKIKSVISVDNHRLYVLFTDDQMREIDIVPISEKYPAFKRLLDNEELFSSVQVDIGGYGLIWDDELDLDAQGIYEQGKVLEGSNSYKEACKAIIDSMVSYRNKINLSQQDLSRLSSIAQPAIARIEKQKVDPQLSTLIKLLDAMGLELQIRERRN